MGMVDLDVLLVCVVDDGAVYHDRASIIIKILWPIQCHQTGSEVACGGVYVTSVFHKPVIHIGLVKY